jgi:hypothetical protein
MLPDGSLVLVLGRGQAILGSSLTRLLGTTGLGRSAVGGLGFMLHRSLRAFASLRVGCRECRATAEQLVREQLGDPDLRRERDRTSRSRRARTA